MQDVTSVPPETAQVVNVVLAVETTQLSGVRLAHPVIPFLLATDTSVDMAV